VMAMSAGCPAAFGQPKEVSPAIKTEAIEYKDGATLLEGYLAYDDAVKGGRPLVLVVHEWWGLNDYAKGRARQLAEMGYVAFAVDMYGKGVLAKDAKQAGELTGPFRSDRKRMRQRITAGLDAAKARLPGAARADLVDARRIAAIGYCFGGTVVLELARSGADIAGVVSFHGGLAPVPDPDRPASAGPAASQPSGTDNNRIKCKVLVCTGADDRSAPMAQLSAFADEMRLPQGKVDYQVNIYGGAVHAFTNPASGLPLPSDDPPRNVAYNANADRRSWQAMKDFFAELFPVARPQP